VAAVPLLAATWVGDLLFSKGGGFSLSTYALVATGTAVVSIPFAYLARAVGRGTQEETFCHVLAGVFTGLLLFVSFATVWGAHSAALAEWLGWHF
jgi:hypothetical protein